QQKEGGVGDSRDPIYGSTFNLERISRIVAVSGVVNITEFQLVIHGSFSGSTCSISKPARTAQCYGARCASSGSSSGTPTTFAFGTASACLLIVCLCSCILCVC